MKPRVSAGIVLFLALGVLIAPLAIARTFIVPHVFEVEGSIINTSNSFDTNMWIAYTAGAVDNEPVSNASVDLYLLEDDGTPMLSTTANPVCNPCTFNLDGTTRKTTAVLETLIASAGGPDFGVRTGFALFEVSGDDEHVAISMGVTNAHSNPFDVDMMFPEVVELPDGLDATMRMIAFPHIFEAAGTILAQTNTFDSVIYAAYAGGVAGSSIPAGTGANVALYLFANDGSFMEGLSGDACSPCAESISSLDPTATFHLDTLISSAGGPNFGVKVGFALVVITGTADAVAIQGVTTNAHSSAFDVTSADLNWQEVPTSARPTSIDTPLLSTLLLSLPNPFSAASTRIDYSLPRAGAATLEIVDVQGRIVARPASGHQTAGEHSIHWDGRGNDGKLLPSGVYFAHLVTEAGVRTLKLTIMR